METIINTESIELMKGAFVDSLVRNNTKIKEDRAFTIAEAAYITYKREIEDIEFKIKQHKRDRDSSLDLSPLSADSLILAVDFDAKKFVEKDIQMGISLRNLEITLEIARYRFNHLFNK
jgi:hypothetical protein